MTNLWIRSHVCQGMAYQFLRENVSQRRDFGQINLHSTMAVSLFLFFKCGNLWSKDAFNQLIVMSRPIVHGYYWKRFLGSIKEYGLSTGVETKQQAAFSNLFYPANQSFRSNVQVGTWSSTFDVLSKRAAFRVMSLSSFTNLIQPDQLSYHL